MKKTCDNCGNEEIVMVIHIFWAHMDIMFVRCLACGTEAIYQDKEE